MPRQQKPSVKTRCVANTYTGPRERIVEFSFTDGTGGLIAFVDAENGQHNVSVYRVDKNITIHTWSPTKVRISKTVEVTR